MGAEGKSEPSAEGSLAAEAVKSASNVALEVYKDAAQPATRQLGEALGKLAKIVVLPITMIAAGTDWLSGLLTRTQRQLAGVPSILQLDSPSTTVTGQILLNYGLLGDDERAENELRDMYASLLASAIDRQTAEATHPAFATMLSQMTGSEAKIINYMALEPTNIWPVIELRERSDNDSSYVTHGRVYGVPEMPSDFAAGERGIDNLKRLGLIIIQFKKEIHPEDPYLEMDSKVKMFARILALDYQDSKFQTTRGIVRLTSLGRQFARVCIRDIQQEYKTNGPQRRQSSR